MIEEDFNSQPHKEADLYPHTTQVLITTFQLTASQGGWRYIQSLLVLDSHFNSQPHKEADEPLFNRRGYSAYFNSQPHKEADHHQWTFPWLRSHFNSQPHKEADDVMIVDYDNQEIISTHSLTRRLTIRPPFLCSVWKHFNSQPHKEADEVTFWIESLSCSFQLTASQGGWPKAVGDKIAAVIFQLTASQGGWRSLESVEWY